MTCHRCGSGWLVQTSGRAEPAAGWECVGCGQTDIADSASTTVTIGDLLAGREPAPV